MSPHGVWISTSVCVYFFVFTICSPFKKYKWGKFLELNMELVVMLKENVRKAASDLNRGKKTWLQACENRMHG